jgi:hypothetical protein
MKLKEKQKKVLETYIASFGVAVAQSYQANSDLGIDGLLIAGLIAVVGPAIRAINPKDPAFGWVANLADAELKKLAEKSASKKRLQPKRRSLLVAELQQIIYKLKS